MDLQFKKMTITEKNELLIHLTTWMNLQGIMLSEKKPIPKDNMLCDFIYVIFINWQSHRSKWLLTSMLTLCLHYAYTKPQISG